MKSRSNQEKKRRGNRAQSFVSKKLGELPVELEFQGYKSHQAWKKVMWLRGKNKLNHPFGEVLCQQRQKRY